MCKQGRRGADVDSGERESDSGRTQAPSVAHGECFDALTRTMNTDALDALSDRVIRPRRAFIKRESYFGSVCITLRLDRSLTREFPAVNHGMCDGRRTGCS